ncbi:MAG: GGDEF domain-containing protein [Immundisolibacteraceae bacterium]|nr:GGDEF domain-containing protein [Immundisolibacteraceae bacterium]
MSYPESVELCGEYLRMSIPLLSRHQMPINPQNYAIAFDLVSVCNKPLTTAFDEITGENLVVTPSDCQQLYNTYIAGAGAQQMSQLRAEFKSMLGETQDITVGLERENSRFGDSLQHELPKLTSGDLGVLNETVKQLIVSGAQMSEANKIIGESLAEKINQVETLKDELEEARKIAKIDPLSGLLNRSGFDDQLELILGRASERAEGVSLVVLEIDCLAEMTSSMGRLVGDKVVRVVAKTIQKSVRGGDVSARVSAGCFAVLLPDTELRGAAAVAENIRVAVEQTVLRRNGDSDGAVSIALSGGVTQWSKAEAGQALFQRGSDALIGAKQRGQNQIAVAVGGSSG